MIPLSLGRPAGPLPTLVLATFLLALLGAWQLRRKSPRWLAAACLLMGTLMAATFTAGCDSGGYLLPKVGGTPVGSYSVTVSATSGSTQHTTTISLTVVAGS
jgi:hypothetical protein